jgi:CheY-like chemotaxis protein
MSKTILLVENKPDDLEVTLGALAEAHRSHDVVTVRDGEQALDYLLRQGPHADRLAGNPSLVLLELDLPGINGLQVLQCIKSNPDLKSIPVVVLTSSRDRKDLTRAYRLKANAYVVKPRDRAKFAEAMRELCLFWGGLNEPPPSPCDTVFRHRSNTLRA